MLHPRTVRRHFPFVTLAAALGLCTEVGAQQESTTGGLDEIVVTATRRQESIQAVPLSITAVTQAALENRAATRAACDLGWY